MLLNLFVSLSMLCFANIISNLAESALQILYSDMATISVAILKHHQKQDGTWNVKIRVGHKSKSSYIDTNHFVIKKQLDKNGKIKDNFILDRLALTLKSYRDKISDYADEVDSMSAAQIKDFLTKKADDGPIDFIEFAYFFVQEKKKTGTNNYKTYQTVANSLRAFHPGKLDITEVDSKFLQRFEIFLFTDQGDRRRGVTAAGLHSEMRDLRAIFIGAKEFYNDDERGILRILHNPFKKYHVPAVPMTAKRNLSLDQIRLIRDMELAPESKELVSRDLFMLSFYLCGMNLIDLHKLKPGKVGRVEYNRSKTMSRRKDKAFISIYLHEEASDLYVKYAGRISERWPDILYLHRYIIKPGLDKVAKIAGIPRLTFYHARHTFATLARNVCRFSKDDVAAAMNHADRKHAVTDIYIAPDWGIIDDVQAGVIGLMKAEES